jgi:hypothetical protein
MNPIILTKTGTGRSTLYAADSFQNPFNVGLVITVSGTATFNIEISMDNPMVETPTTWAAATGFSALSASTVGSLTIPCHAISVNITSGSGTVTANLVQAGVR